MLSYSKLKPTNFYKEIHNRLFSKAKIYNGVYIIDRKIARKIIAFSKISSWQIEKNSQIKILKELESLGLIKNAKSRNITLKVVNSSTSDTSEK